MRIGPLVERLRGGVAARWKGARRWPPRAALLRTALWMVMALAVAAWVWILWTETLHRR